MDKGVEHLSSLTALQKLGVDRCSGAAEEERRRFTWRRMLAAPADAGMHSYMHRTGKAICEL
jgi:hypothetical protein